ncbi:MAG: pantetheine-phosphate adenylyltransferase [Hyphomicrobiales bacterium]
MARTAFYPGSFDPVTFGHLDVIARACRIVDRLVLAVGAHHEKSGLIPVDTRVALLKTVTKPLAEHAGIRIDVTTFKGLAVDAAREAGAAMILRGLRDASDFDYEVRMGQMNGSMAPEIETVFLAASPATRMIASSLVKQIAKMGGDVSAFLPEPSLKALKEALK